MIKVNTVALEENASNLQKIESQVANILYDVSQVERELICNHTVFENEVLAIQKQMEKIEGETDKIRIMYQNLQQISEQYAQAERKIKELDGTRTDPGSEEPSITARFWVDERYTKIIPGCRPWPDQRNAIWQIWISQWIVKDFWKNHRRKHIRRNRRKVPMHKKYRFTAQIDDRILIPKLYRTIQILVK